MTIPRYPRPHRDAAPFDPPPDLAALPPVCLVRNLDDRPVRLVSGYAEARALALDRRLSSDPTRPGFPRLHGGVGPASSKVPLVQMDGSEHAYWRRLVGHEFTESAVRLRQPRVDDLVAGLIDDLVDAGPPSDLVATVANPLPTMVICELLGVPLDERQLFRRYANANFALATDPDTFTELHFEVMSYLSELVDDKLAAPTDDLLSRLAAHQETAAGVPHESIVSFACMLLVTGAESTARVLALSVLALLTQGRHWERLAAGDDPALLDATVEELLRFVPVSTGMGRVAVRPVEVGGCRIAAGEGVILNFDLANRDPSVFPDPHLLDLDRRSPGHLSFGGGIHTCLGRFLARAELRSVLCQLSGRLPELRLARPVEELTFHHDSYLYGVEELPLAWPGATR